MDHGTLALMIPIIAIGAPFLMVIVGQMAKHQREMAELYHRNVQPAADARVDALQRDVADLKDLVHQQTIALDRMGAPLPTVDVQDRVRP